MEQKSPVHVLYVLTKLELGGAQKVCLSLLEGLAQYGCQSSLVSGTGGPLVTRAKKHKSVFLIDSFKREIGLVALWSEFKTFIQLIKIMRRLKKQHPRLVVHTHSTKAGILGRWAAFFARVTKRVHTVHGFGFHAFQNKIIWFVIFACEWITALITTHFVCVSHEDKKTGSRLLPGFAKKSSIIRAAVEWDKFYQPARITCMDKHNQFIFGSVSCFKPQKNLFDLLNAFKKVQEQLGNLVRLQIIGNGALRPKLETFIKEHNLNDSIDLLGWRSDVSSWMKSWDVLVMSSLWEGLPCTVIEARLSKLPVISYPIGGIPEVILDGKNGFLSPVGNWHTLASRMIRIATDKNCYTKLSQYRDQLDDFKDGIMIKQHTSLYKQLFTKN